MNSFSIVEDLDVLEQALLKFLFIPKPLAVDPVEFQGLEERFGYSVVAAVSFCRSCSESFCARPAFPEATPISSNQGKTSSTGPTKGRFPKYFSSEREKRVQKVRSDDFQANVFNKFVACKINRLPVNNLTVWVISAAILGNAINELLRSRKALSKCELSVNAGIKSINRYSSPEELYSDYDQLHSALESNGTLSQSWREFNKTILQPGRNRPDESKRAFPPGLPEWPANWMQCLPGPTRARALTLLQVKDT